MLRTRDLIRLMGVMIDLYCASYAKPPDAVTLDTSGVQDDRVRRTRARVALARKRPTSQPG